MIPSNELCNRILECLEIHTRGVELDFLIKVTNIKRQTINRLLEKLEKNGEI